jgi:hypothetical protein
MQREQKMNEAIKEMANCVVVCQMSPLAHMQILLGETE